MIILSVLHSNIDHRKNNFPIRYYKWTFPQRSPPWWQKKVAVVQRFKQESFAFSFTSNLWRIIFDRDPDSHFVIDGDLYNAICWSDHQVMVLILLRETFGVGLQGAPSLVEIYICISWWILVIKQQRRRQRRNRHLKSEFVLLQTVSRLFNLIQFVKCWQFFSGIGY